MTLVHHHSDASTILSENSFQSYRATDGTASKKFKQLFQSSNLKISDLISGRFAKTVPCLAVSSSSPSKFVCLHFKLIVSQTFILLVKNLSQVPMFSRKLSTICIYSRTVNCSQNFRCKRIWLYETKRKYFLIFVHLIDVKLNPSENIQMYKMGAHGTSLRAPIK